MIQYLYIIGALYLFVCPFTKVEESFNLQAMHDIIYHKWNFTEFDHFEFPGVVPRSFLGPLIATLLASPVITILDVLELISTNKFICQYIVRAAIGCCALYSLQKLHKSIKEVFGEGVAFWFLLLTASQYHFMYYLSRPLPNILVLPLVLLAINSWIKQDHVGLVCFSSAAVIIFRFELVILLGFILLIEVFKGHVSLISVIKTGLMAGVCALVATVTVDTFFWRRLIWPEGEVFWFNAILNKSSQWGVSPFLWYWYSALPRALGTSITLVPFGDKRTKLLITPAIFFILALSFLPHKELRFIIYTFPLFNIAVASACHKLWINRHKSMSRWIASIYVILHLLANVCLSCILLKVASENYPGGTAISRLHKLVSPDVNAHVYIDNLAAQSGVSRFTQINSNWIYNKTENLPPGSEDYFLFTHLLLEAKSKYSPNLKPFINSHEILDIIEGFSHIHFNYNSFPPVKMKYKPMIFILKRNFIPKSIYKRRNATLPQVKQNKVEAEINEVEEPQINGVYKTQLNDVEEKRIHEMEGKQINEVKEKKIHEEEEKQINEVEGTQINEVKETQINEVEETQINKVEEPQINEDKETQINEIDEIQINENVKTQINFVQETQINEDEETQINEDKETQINENEDKEAQINENEKEKIQIYEGQETQISRVGKTQIYEGEETQVSRAGKTQIYEGEETQINRVGKTQIYEGKETQINRIEETEINVGKETEINVGKETQINEVGKTEINGAEGKQTSIDLEVNNKEPLKIKSNATHRSKPDVIGRTLDLEVEKKQGNSETILKMSVDDLFDDKYDPRSIKKKLSTKIIEKLKLMKEKKMKEL